MEPAVVFTPHLPTQENDCNCIFCTFIWINLETLLIKHPDEPGR